MTINLISKRLGFEKNIKSTLNFVICFILILLFFHVRYGLGILNPIETAWLMKYDWAQHYIGWYFFRNDPWSFPLGTINSLFYPSGTNVGFTDSIPLMAILLKPFNKILPEQFQYFGFWLFMCHLLVAYFSIKVFKLFKIEGVAQLIGVLLITFCPVLIYRAMHSALSAHWLVVANIWIYFLDPAQVSKKKILLYQLILLVIGGLVNPYFSLINGGFLFILALKFWISDKVLNLKEVSVYVGGSLIILLVFWILTGYFSLSDASHLGVVDAYGFFSWNLSSFFNPFIFDRFYDFYTNNISSFLSAHELASWEQYESFSYLGLGILILSTIMAIAGITTSDGRRVISDLFRKIPMILLIMITVLFSLFAISNRVTFNSSVLFAFPLPSFLKLFTDIFRASARFIWVFYYLWFFFLVILSVRVIKKSSYVGLLLGLVLCIQLVDIQPMIFNKKLAYGPYKPKINEMYWNKLFQSTDKILFLPPLGTSYVTPDDWQYFSFLAVQNRKPISIGHIARIDFASSRSFHQKMLDDITQMNLDSTAIYIMNPVFYSQILTNYSSKKADVVLLDGYLIVCPTSHKYEGLMAVLSEIKDNENQDFIQKHFSKTKPITYNRPVTNSSILKVGIYEISPCAESIVIRGWGFIDDNQNTKVESVNILIENSRGKVSYASTNRFGTSDVVEFFKNSYLAKVGFASILDTQTMQNGKYRIGIEINRTGSGGITQVENMWLDNYIILNNPVEPAAVKWSDSNGQIRYDINVLKVTEKEIVVEGWAFSEKILNNLQIYITLSNDRSQLAYKATSVIRPDVSAFFKRDDLQNAGFIVKFSKELLQPGSYVMGILINSEIKKLSDHIKTDKVIDIKLSEDFPKPVVLDRLPSTGENVRGNIDVVAEEKHFIKIEGWAYIDQLNYKDSKTFLVLKSHNKYFKIPCQRRYRPDVKEAFKLNFESDSTGFNVILRKEYFPKNEYQILLMIEDKNSQVSNLLPMNNSIEF